MRKVLLVVLILAASGVLRAQDAASAQAPAPAPKLGHPLDPADVDILTGKTRAPAYSAYRGYAGPYAYGYPANASLFGQSRFAQVSTATQPPFAPLVFGRVGRRSFIVIGTTTPVGSGFFFLGGARRSAIFFPVPVRPGFMLWRP